MRKRKILISAAWPDIIICKSFPSNASEWNKKSSGEGYRGDAKVGQ